MPYTILPGKADQENWKIQIFDIYLLSFQLCLQNLQKNKPRWNFNDKIHVKIWLMYKYLG